MIGWALYVIGALTVVTELLDVDAGRFSHVPAEHRRYLWALIVIITLLWPLGALALVIARIRGALEHG